MMKFFIPTFFHEIPQIWQMMNRNRKNRKLWFFRFPKYQNPSLCLVCYLNYFWSEGTGVKYTTLKNRLDKRYSFKNNSEASSNHANVSRIPKYRHICYRSGFSNLYQISSIRYRRCVFFCEDYWLVNLNRFSWNLF